MRTYLTRVATVVLASCLAAPAAMGQAAPTSFVYQGRLKQNAALFTGPCDFIFRLYDAAGTGNPPVGGTLINGMTLTFDGVGGNPPPITVEKGLFAASLNFGAGAFDGNERWLDMQVRCPSGVGSYVSIAPRQYLSPAPYALFATDSVDRNSLNASDGNPQDALYLDANGNVGIKTTTPNADLHLRDTVTDLLIEGTGNTASLTLSSNSTGNVQIWTPGSSDDMRFFVGGQDRMALTAAGNVGIGTTNPVRRLQVESAGPNESIYVIKSDPTQLASMSFQSFGGPLWEIGKLPSEDFFIRTPAAPDAMFIDYPSGNVGIGTTTPSAGLHVRGSYPSPSQILEKDFPDADVQCVFRRSADADPDMYLTYWGNSDRNTLALTNGAGRGLHVTTGGRVVVGNFTSTNFSGDGQFVVMDGNVGIGTTTPQATLHVNGPTLSSHIGTAAGTFAIQAPFSTGGAYTTLDFIGSNDATRPTARISAFHSNAGSRLHFGTSSSFGAGVTFDALVIGSDGHVGIGRISQSLTLEVEGNASKTTAGDWLANSDRRIKTEIQPVENALDTLERVRMRSFRYSDAYRAAHPSIEDRRYLNVVAQEFAEVFPDHVRGSGERLPQTPGTGNREQGTETGEILQVDPWPLTIYSVAAIQELHAKTNARHESLRVELADRDRRIADQESEISNLKSRIESQAAAMAELSARLERLETAGAVMGGGE